MLSDEFMETTHSLETILVRVQRADPGLRDLGKRGCALQASDNRAESEVSARPVSASPVTGRRRSGSSRISPKKRAEIGANGWRLGWTEMLDRGLDLRFRVE